MTTPMSNRLALPIPEDATKKRRWVNVKEMVMMQRREEGWKPVLNNPQDDELQKVLRATGQEVPQGAVIQRGDVMLMEMDRVAWEENVQRPKAEARERQQVSVDTMIANANDNTKAALRKHLGRGARIPEDVVFSEEADSKIRGGSRE